MTIPCFREENSEVPKQCYDPILNYILTFDAEKWRPVLNDIGDSTADLLLNISQFSETFPYSVFGILPKQNILFDLPYYYIGKLVRKIFTQLFERHHCLNSFVEAFIWYEKSFLYFRYPSVDLSLGQSSKQGLQGIYLYVHVHVDKIMIVQ